MKDLEGEWTIFQLEAELEHFGPHRIMKIHNEMVRKRREASRLLTLVLEMAREGNDDMEMLKLDKVDVERLLEARKILEVL